MINYISCFCWLISFVNSTLRCEIWSDRHSSVVDELSVLISSSFAAARGEKSGDADVDFLLHVFVCFFVILDLVVTFGKFKLN